MRGHGIIITSTNAIDDRNEPEGEKMPKMLTPKEIAAAIDTDARTLRKFLRSIDSVESPGKGGRYAIDARRVNSLKKQFNAWIDAKSPKGDETPDAG